MISSVRILYQSPFNKKQPLFALYRFFYWKLIRVFKMKRVRFSLWGNKKIYLDYDSFQCMWLMYNYIYDWEEFNLIAHFLKPGDIVGDVGSNMGIYTIWMSKFIDNGTIHSFEPDTLNYEKLKENIKVNLLEKSTRLNKLGLSNEDGTVSFTYGLDGENHIAVKNETNIVPVAVKRLDTYTDENGILFFSYLKIDVEGFENAVLQGAEKLLKEKRIKIIQLELNNTVINSGLKFEATIQLLQQFNYSLCGYNVTSNKLEVVEFNSLRENYFAVSDIYEANMRLNANA